MMAQPEPSPEGMDWTAGGSDIVFQHCPNCRNAWYFRRSFCQHCGSRDVALGTSAGRGTVYAVTSIHRAPSPQFRDEAPYPIVLVDLDEGVRVMGGGEAGLAIGDRVVHGAGRRGGRAIPFFGLDPSS